jgi:hypothetical protein
MVFVALAVEHLEATNAKPDLFRLFCAENNSQNSLNYKGLLLPPTPYPPFEM